MDEETSKEEQKNIQFNENVVQEYKEKYRDVFEIAKLFYMNNWLEVDAEKKEEFRYIDFCNENEEDFFTKIMYYEIMKSRGRFSAENTSNLSEADLKRRCEECDMEACAMKLLHYILALAKDKADEIFEINKSADYQENGINQNTGYQGNGINQNIGYQGNEINQNEGYQGSAEFLSWKNQEQIEEDYRLKEKIKASLNPFDEVTISLVKLIIRNKMVEIENIENGTIYYKYINMQKQLEQKSDKMEMQVILENLIKRQNVEEDAIQIHNIESIRESYNSIFKNNPYKLAAYVEYLAITLNIPAEALLDIYEKEKRSDLKKQFYLRYAIKRIDNLFITEESKENIKKLIIYSSKWKGIDLPYLPFNLIIYTNKYYLVSEIASILRDSLTFYGYFDSKFVIETVNNLIDNRNDRGLEQVYTELGSGILVLKDFMSIDILNPHEKNVFLQSLEEWMTDKFWDICTIIYTDQKSALESLLSLNSRLLEMQFYCVVEEVKPTQDYVLKEIIKRCKYLYKVTPQFQEKLAEYVDETYKNTRLNTNDYIQKVYENIVLNKESMDYNQLNLDENDETRKMKYYSLQQEVVPTYNREKTLEQIFQEINKLVGLENIKETLVELADLLAFKKRATNIVSLDDINLNMVFAGNPGTGKTTVARLIAEILYNLEYIKTKKVVEVDGKDLIGEYIGTTAQKTMGIVKKALGGVLFIDEAYALICANGTNSSFSEECMATLIRAMEENKNDLIIIFAGYTKEMQEFIKFNSGIVSRIGYHLEFRDYTIDELVKIFKKIVKEKGFIYTDGLIEEVRKMIEIASKKTNFGNGRFVRNLYQKIIIKHAGNTKNEQDDVKLKTLSEHDVDMKMLEKIIGTEGKQIGFKM